MSNGDLSSGDQTCRLKKQGQWFDQYTSRLEGCFPLPLRCPCCYSLSLEVRADWEICPICFWEDDGQDDHDADVVRGGPNGTLSLTQARANFLRFGAWEERFVDKVRSPHIEELPE